MNATSLELPETGYGRGAGLFPVYAMMNTSCRNNTRSTVMEDHKVEIRAKTRIRAGEEITNEYLKPESSTLLRRSIINTKWFFYCSCPRCLDPTELGKHRENKVFSLMTVVRFSLWEPVVSPHKMWGPRPFHSPNKQPGGLEMSVLSPQNVC